MELTCTGISSTGAEFLVRVPVVFLKKPNIGKSELHVVKCGSVCHHRLLEHRDHVGLYH